MGIKQAREAKGMTKMDLAAKVGVSYTTIQMWERGISKPSPQNLDKLKKIFGKEGLPLND